MRQAIQSTLFDQGYSIENDAIRAAMIAQVPESRRQYNNRITIKFRRNHHV